MGSEFFFECSKKYYSIGVNENDIKECTHCTGVERHSPDVELLGFWRDSNHPPAIPEGLATRHYSLQQVSLCDYEILNTYKMAYYRVTLPMYLF